MCKTFLVFLTLLDMENNERNSKAQHSTGKHPEPSENVQSEIETVTPEAENPGLEDMNKQESQDKSDTASEHDQGSLDGSAKEQDSEQQDNRQQETDEQDNQQQTTEQQGTEEQDTDQPDSEEQDPGDQTNTDEPAEGDVRGDVETVSP